MLQDKDLKIKKLTEENKQLKEKGIWYRSKIIYSS